MEQNKVNRFDVTENIILEQILYDKDKQLKRIKQDCKTGKFGEFIQLLILKKIDFNNGLIFEDKKTSKLLGFTLFKYGIADDIHYLDGKIRASAQKGVGRLIQKYMELFAHQHKCKFIRIEPIDELIEYYKKFGYICLDFDPGSMFKIIDESFNILLIKNTIDYSK